METKPLIPGTIIFPPTPISLQDAQETVEILNADEADLTNIDPEYLPWKYKIEEVGNGNALIKVYDENGSFTGYL